MSKFYKLILTVQIFLVMYIGLVIAAGNANQNGNNLPGNYNDEELIEHIRSLQSGAETSNFIGKMNYEDWNRIFLFDDTIINDPIFRNKFESYLDTDGRYSIGSSILISRPEVTKQWLGSYGIDFDERNGFGDVEEVGINPRSKELIIERISEGAFGKKTKTFIFDLEEIKQLSEIINSDGNKLPLYNILLTGEGNLKINELLITSGRVYVNEGVIGVFAGELDVTNVRSDFSLEIDGGTEAIFGDNKIIGLFSEASIISFNKRTSINIDDKSLLVKSRGFSIEKRDGKKDLNIDGGLRISHSDGRHFFLEGSVIDTFDAGDENNKLLARFIVSGEDIEFLRDSKNPLNKDSFIRELVDVKGKVTTDVKTLGKVELEKDNSIIIFEEGGLRIIGLPERRGAAQYNHKLEDDHEMKISSLNGRTVFAKCSEPCREVGHAYNRLKGQLNDIERSVVVNGELKPFMLNIDPETIVTEAYNLEGSDIEVFRTILPSTGVTETYLTDLGNGDVFYKEGDDDFQKYYINDLGEIELLKVVDSPTATSTVKWAMNNEIRSRRSGEHSLPLTGFSITPKVDVKMIGELSEFQFGRIDAGDVLIQSSRAINADRWNYNQKTGNWDRLNRDRERSVSPKEFNEIRSTRGVSVEVIPYKYEGFEDIKAGASLKIKDSRGVNVGSIERSNLRREYYLYGPSGKKIGSYNNPDDAKRAFESKALHEYYIKPKGRR